ncbi:MAG: right-handed parallel beta-helix repeat-containing protein, partial [Candidatus Thermoplasmatota archaeon]
MKGKYVIYGLVLFGLVIALNYMANANNIQTIEVGGLFATNAKAIATCEKFYTGEGSWKVVGSTAPGKFEFYVYWYDGPAGYPDVTHNLGVFTIDDIQTISYYTNKPLPTDGTNPYNFYLVIYTLPDGFDDYGWYGYSLTADPYLSENLSAPANTWVKWSTDDGANKLTFYDWWKSGTYGFYGEPTLQRIQEGIINWLQNYSHGVNQDIDYGLETVMAISFQTGSGWYQFFDGYIDKITITLKNGTSLTIDLENKVWVDDDYDSSTFGFGYDHFNSIQQGVNAVGEGGKVIVNSGTYTETLTFATANYLTIKGSDPSNRPVVDGGVKFANNVAFYGLTLQNLYFKGSAGGGGGGRIFWNANTAPIYDFSMDNCVLDGEMVDGRYGIYGHLFGGSFSITNCEFKNIYGFAVMDIDGSSDYSPYGGNGLPLTTVTFANNYIHDCDGSVALRGYHKTSDPDWQNKKTDVVNVYNNRWENIGGHVPSTDDHWAAIEINSAKILNFYNNIISHVTMGIYGEGQGVQLWDINTLNMYENSITDCAQAGIFVFGGGTGNPYGGPWPVPGGSIYHNNIIAGGLYGILVDSGATGGPLDAEYNYWGDASGPYHPTLNPSGLGNNVSDNVDFHPWWETPTGSIAPTTTKEIGTPIYGDYLTSSTQITLIATDGESGVKATYYRIWYDGAWTDWITYTGPFTLTGECLHYLEYYSEDKAGTIEDVHNQTHYVDNTPPTTTLTFGTPYYTDGVDEWITSSTPITLTSTDGGACACGVYKIYYRINGGAWNEYTAPFTIPDECTHTIEYYAVDNLGNTETTKSQTVKVDNTPPTTTLTFGTPYYTDGVDEWITSSTPITLTSTDGGA